LNNRIILLEIMLFALANNANAFPLNGGNGEVNAAVLGTYRSTNDMIILDINSTDRIDVVELVDVDDKFYAAEKQNTRRVGDIDDNSLVSWRTLYCFNNVPQDMEIKKVKITPSNGDPFPIDWEGVPEIKSTPLSMKFFGLSVNTERNITAEVLGGLSKTKRGIEDILGKLSGEKVSDETERNTDDVSEEISLNQWIADVMITNTGTTRLDVKITDFSIIDQFDFSYSAEGNETKKLMEKEPMRIPIKFENISKLSRPIYLVYKPSNIRLDISSWA